MRCNLHPIPSVHGMYNNACDVCFVYGEPNLENRSVIWDRLKIIYNKFQLPTLIMGDFTRVEYISEKLGESAKIKG